MYLVVFGKDDVLVKGHPWVFLGPPDKETKSPFSLFIPFPCSSFIFVYVLAAPIFAFSLSFWKGGLIGLNKILSDELQLPIYAPIICTRAFVTFESIPASFPWIPAEFFPYPISIYLVLRNYWITVKKKATFTSYCLCFSFSRSSWWNWTEKFYLIPFLSLPL